MTNYDIFNGDADGICALQQLRLCEPKESVLVTGLKRDIDLLSRVDTKVEQGDKITVLDISLDKNREGLDKVLVSGADVFYADHHFSGEIPTHQNLNMHIDPAPDTCTSLIVNQYLNGQQAHWAIVGAFGDNLDSAAEKLGRSIGMSDSDLIDYQQLGICLNYNGYGFELEDLMYHPAALFELVNAHQNPLDFIHNETGYVRLLEQYKADMEFSKNIKAQNPNESAAVFLLPNKSWAKRIVGVMGNDLAKINPHRAHALLVDMGDAHYRVSVRAPYNTKSGADKLCRQFESGGGRQAAAGINRLPESELVRFVEAFEQSFARAL
jgi:hypothetical protein